MFTTTVHGRYPVSHVGRGGTGCIGRVGRGGTYLRIRNIHASVCFLELAFIVELTLQFDTDMSNVPQDPQLLSVADS